MIIPPPPDKYCIPPYNFLQELQKLVNKDTNKRLNKLEREGKIQNLFSTKPPTTMIDVAPFISKLEKLKQFLHIAIENKGTFLGIDFGYIPTFPVEKLIEIFNQTGNLYYRPKDNNEHPIKKLSFEEWYALEASREINERVANLLDSEENTSKRKKIMETLFHSGEVKLYKTGTIE